MKHEHILIIRFSALGDVAMAVPVVYSLAQQYPHIRITVLSREFARPFFENLAPNVGFMAADIKHEYHGVKGLNTLYRRLTAKKFTAIADLHNVLRSSYLRMRFNLGRYHVAHVNKHRKGKRRLTSSNKKILKQQPTSFQNYAEVLERLGYPVTVKFRSIFPPEGGDLSQLPETFQVKDAEETWIGIAPFGGSLFEEQPQEPTLPLWRWTEGAGRVRRLVYALSAVPAGLEGTEGYRTGTHPDESSRRDAFHGQRKYAHGFRCGHSSGECMGRNASLCRIPGMGTTHGGHGTDRPPL